MTSEQRGAVMIATCIGIFAGHLAAFLVSLASIGGLGAINAVTWYAVWVGIPELWWHWALGGGIAAGFGYYLFRKLRTS